MGEPFVFPSKSPFAAAALPPATDDDDDYDYDEDDYNDDDHHYLQQIQLGNKRKIQKPYPAEEKDCSDVAWCSHMEDPKNYHCLKFEYL